MTKLTRDAFGTMPDGTPVERLEIGSDALRVGIVNWAATIQDVRLTGAPWPLTLGATSLTAYREGLRSFGVIVGPVANRVRDGRVVIDGETYQMPVTSAGFAQHSGPDTTRSRVWTVEAHAPDRVLLSLTLEDGVAGLPGQRQLTADYTVTGNTLRMTLGATTTARTPINLANHSYWNLDGTTDIRGHHLRVDADQVVALDDQLLPTGALDTVKGTHLDHRTLSPFNPQPGAGYNHNYCLSRARRALTQAAELRGTKGVWMRMATTEPGLQVFDADTTDTGAHIGHTGVPYGPYCSIALEAQGWPDATTHDAFPTVMLDAGETYEQITEWSFGRDGG